METANLSDRQIVQAILDRDTVVTKEFLYRKCYPLFKSVYNKYYTDCENCFELIDEIYVYIMIPQKNTGISKLAAFGFRCTLTMWLRIVVENYCRQLYARRMETDSDSDAGSDRNMPDDESLTGNTRNIDMEDVHKILNMMPNQRYRRLIEYRYVNEKTNKETAMLLGMTMANYYNKHKLAKAQYCEALRKEGLI
ncbi:MAG: sigma-70 family RNA polymerase sigma factor [Bacteroidales bacterium]|nr:sigma-70 family RNA polymerase sigma factor [Bacteroidales bacterium]MCM1146625.1 sigma-70 family RNA polymerase sigma factor [Bacteroidales bacterium]MCM1206017.1 sigma-70 family RNA polymerase sigma factor [Bacillota bacterium]